MVIYIPNIYDTRLRIADNTIFTAGMMVILIELIQAARKPENTKYLITADFLLAK